MTILQSNLCFGDAIKALKNLHFVCRAGWNCRGEYLWLLPAANVKAEWCREPHLKAAAEANGGEIECLGSIRMMTADRKVLTGWLASQTDILADDWQIVDPNAFAQAQTAPDSSEADWQEPAPELPNP